MRVELFIIYYQQTLCKLYVGRIIYYSLQQTRCTAWQIYSATAIGNGCMCHCFEGLLIMTVEAAGLEAGVDAKQ